MAGIFSPKTAELIDIGKSVAMGDEGSLPELKRALAECRKYINDFEGTFISLSPFFASDERGEELRHFIGRDFEELRESFDDLDEVIKSERFIELNPVLYSVEKCAMRLSGDVDDLSKMSDRIESPIPIANMIIKASYGVTEDRVSADNISALIPPLAVYVKSSEREVSLFGKLYPDEKKIIDASGRLLNDMKKAVGALMVFAGKKDKAALVDGVRMLKFASTSFYAVLRLMDAVSSSKSEFSKVAAADKLCRCLSLYRAGAVSKQDMLAEFNMLGGIAKSYSSLVDFVSGHHFRHYVKEQLDDASSALASFKRFWEPVLSSARRGSFEFDSKRLGSEFDSMASAASKLSHAFESEFDKVSASPFAEELKDVIGRYLSGSVILEYFSTCIQDFSMRHQDLLFQFREKARNSHSAMEVYELLELQGTGVEQLMMFLEDSDKSRLIAGMRDIEASLPRLIEIRNGISPLKNSERPVCPGCGKPAPVGERICPSCGAVIPKGLSTSLGAGYDEFLAEDPLPARLELLFNAAASWRAGGIGVNELIQEFKNYRSVVKQVRREYASKSKEFANALGSLYDNAVNFESAIKRLDGIIDNIIDMLETGRDIDGEMSNLRFAGYCLEDIRKNLR